MKVNGNGLGSEQLRNFIVENTFDNSIALDCRITYVFRYKESDIRDITDSMVVWWPTASQQTIAHTKRE